MAKGLILKNFRRKEKNEIYNKEKITVEADLDKLIVHKLMNGVAFKAVPFESNVLSFHLKL